MHPEVSVSITVNIARSLAEAETQLKTGVVVTGEIKDDTDADEHITSQSEQVESTTTLADGDETADDAETTNDATDG